MGKREKIISIAFVLTILLTNLSTIVKVEASSTIYIRSNGDVDPSSAPIQRNGDVYTFTDDIHEPLVVQRDNIVIDGANHEIIPLVREDYGVDLKYRSNVTVKNIGITNFNYCFNLDASSGCSIINNTIWNSYYGFYIQGSGNVIRGNTFDNNWAGIGIYYCSGNTIIGNTIMNSKEGGVGIDLYQAESNTILENDIKSNSEGVSILGKNNRFFHNNFDNGHQVDVRISDPWWRANYWDNGYPSGGNYWSDWNYSDNKSGPNQDQPGSDGIIDTHRHIELGIDNDNTDNYPLIEPWKKGNLKISFSADKYNVNISDWVTFQWSFKNIGNDKLPYVIELLDTYYMARGAFEPIPPEFPEYSLEPGETYSNSWTMQAKKAGEYTVFLNVFWMDMIGDYWLFHFNITITIADIVPKLSVEPNSLDFGEVTKGETRNGYFNIKNIGSVTLDWQIIIETGYDWLSVYPFAGSTTTETDTIEVTVQTANINVGNHTGRIKVTSNGGEAYVTILIEVEEVPTVLIDIKIESSRERLEHWKNEAYITFRTKNQGNYVARDVLVTITLPYNFQTQDPKTWTGQINPGEERVLTIKINATRCVDGLIIVQVVYRDASGNMNAKEKQYTLPVRELILLEHAGSWTDVNLSPQSVQSAKTIIGADNLAAGMWLDALILNLGLDEFNATRMLNYADRLVTWMKQLWNEGKVDPEILTFLVDAIASVALNTVTLCIASHQPQRLLNDGTMNYHAIWLMNAVYEVLEQVKDLYLQMIDQVVRKPASFNFVEINDPQGKLYLQVFADGKQLSTYYVEDIAFVMVDANATIIRYVIDAVDAQYPQEQYDWIFFSIRSGEIVEERTTTETIAKNEQQEVLIKMKPDGSIESIVIIPEFPNVLIPLLLVMILLAVLLSRKRKNT